MCFMDLLTLLLVGLVAGLLAVFLVGGVGFAILGDIVSAAQLTFIEWAETEHPVVHLRKDAGPGLSELVAGEEGEGEEAQVVSGGPRTHGARSAAPGIRWIPGTTSSRSTGQTSSTTPRAASNAGWVTHRG
jgi:hypothetical protein